MLDEKELIKKLTNKIKYQKDIIRKHGYDNYEFKSSEVLTHYHKIDDFTEVITLIKSMCEE